MGLFLPRPKTGSLKGWFLLGTGALLCPCHLPVTLFVLTTVFAGTAFGGFLSENIWLIGGAIAAYSITALALGYRMLSKTYGWRLFRGGSRSGNT